MYNNIIISGVSKYIPSRKFDNDFFIDHFHEEKWGNKEIEGLLKKLERKERYFAEKSETSLSMATNAVEKLIRDTKVNVDDIDMVVFVSDTPEYTCPANALKIANAINAKNAHRVTDMNVNCLGMVQAFDNVACIMKNRKEVKKCILVGSVIFSNIVRFDDSVTYPNFGDAACAVLLEKKEETIERGILSSTYYTDNSYCNQVHYPACGNSAQLMGKHHKYYRRLEWIPFNTDFVIDYLITCTKSVMEQEYILASDIVLFAYSQFSPQYAREALKKLSMDSEKYVYLGDKYGYTGNTSPFLVLEQEWGNIKNQTGKYILFCSYGTGVTFGCVAYKI